MILIIIILICLLLISTGFNIFTTLKNNKSKDNYSKLLSQKKSSEVVLGQIAEQLAPFTKNFKYEPHKVKFLGQPVDYIYFGEDKIVILEVKSGNSKLTPKQVQIKNLIKNKQVFWEEFRIPEQVKKPESVTDPRLKVVADAAVEHMKNKLREPSRTLKSVSNNEDKTSI